MNNQKSLLSGIWKAGQKMIFLILCSLSLISCDMVTLEIEEVPENTPAGVSIFVAGNFNIWDAGDGNFRLEKARNGKYYVDLPLGWGDVEYKFTRGDWTSVEADGCGHSIENRKLSVGTNLWRLFTADTLNHRVYSWEDLGPTHCDKVTFRLKRLPKETPEGSEIHLVGSFNDWNPGNKKHQFKRSDVDDCYYLDLTKSDTEIEYKITRGGWDTEEVDNNGDRLPNRTFVFGKKDTVDLEVDGWLDINPGLEQRQVTFLVNTPLGTPPGDPVYILGNFNKWIPGDPRFEMKKMAANIFSITIKKPEGMMEYKFTRGPWGKEEVDVFGNHISNRRLRSSADTIKISIPEWLDIPMDQTFTLNREEINFIMNHPEVVAFPLTEGEKSVKFTLAPKITKPTYFYIRVALPSSPNNRNYGFVDLVQPGQEIKIATPEGTVFYACDGPYWNDYEPKEKKVFVVTTDMDGKVINGNSLLPPK